MLSLASLKRLLKASCAHRRTSSFSANKAGSTSSLAAGTLSLRSEVVYVDEEFGELISEYSLEQAIDDGVLVEVFNYNTKDFVEKYTNGKPVVATAHLFNQMSQTTLIDLWNEYVDWRLNIKETLLEEDQMFVTEIKGKNVWVIEDGQAITMMYPEDY